MVGLRLRPGCVVEEGDAVYPELVPWAAALSDDLLDSHCAACFGHCPTSRFRCPGPCQGALLYCSPSCRDLDLPLHFRSAECNLLSLLTSLSSPVESSCFPSLGGTCDIRTALRLLAQHYSLNHITHFLSESCHTHGVDHPRLGGLLSNRSTLLQPHPSSEEVHEREDEESHLASELREAAMLMYHVRYSIPRYTEHDSTMHMDCCVDANRHYSQPFEDAGLQVEEVCMAASVHIRTCSNASETASEHVDKGGHLDIHENEHVEMHEARQENVCADMAQCSAVDEHHTTDLSTRSYTKLGGIDGKVLLTHAQEILLAQEVLCQVFTNAVRVQVDSWTANGHLKVQPTELGTAVYGPLLSWINHSCRPNALYSFLVGAPVSTKGRTHEVLLIPDMDIKDFEHTWGLKSSLSWFEKADHKGTLFLQHYSPRAQLRSIRSIKGPEPVYISYIDLLQPKNTRRLELWLKYRFHCTCERCNGKSTKDVDEMLQTVGFHGNQSEMLIFSEWLREEAQRGMREFLENGNPLSCCAILEGALLRILHDACQSYCDIESPQSESQMESSNLGGHGCVEISMSDGRHVKVHLMHHLCLNMFMALSSSYKILAGGFSNSSYEAASNGNAIAMHSLCVGVGERREVDCSIASAAYSLVLALTTQSLCDFGEPGLWVIAARFWLQTWEAVINLISKLDSYFCLDSMTEMQSLVLRCSSEFKSIVLSPENDFLRKLKDIFSTCWSLQNSDSAGQLLQCSATALWPLLQSTSQFLCNIESLFDINEVRIRASTGILETKNDWIHYRGEALVCALCFLRHGLKFMDILYGSGEKLVEAMEEFLRLKFCFC